ncbi:trace amine-associated receptor 7e-like [Paramacrobiotus metropolitanus]|uniref:trace amine-associated receptor 7e-like n=1 Tax=Paramacrobiotus metropolitanus TaxID=2943436 RepID=UPI002445D4A8|nr:trace amine-associated receptor 7e-like [Paramacrobiotus metropolitanus]
MIDEKLLTVNNWEIWNTSFNVTNLTITKSLISPNPDCPVYAFNVLLRTLISIICIPQNILTICMNLIVLYLFIAKRELRLPQHYYLINLSLCDALVGLIALPSRLTLDLSGCWPAPFVFCRIYKIIDWTITSEASTTIMLVAYNRYKMISKGAAFANEETHRKVICNIIYSWVFNLLLYGPVQLMDVFTGIRISGGNQCKNEFFQIIWLGNFLVVTSNILPPIIVFILYGWIFLALQKRKRKLAAGKASLKSTDTNSLQNGDAKPPSSNKQATTMMILTTTFLITSCPCGICSAVMFVCSDEYFTTVYQIYLTTLYLLYGNSLVNCVVYATKVPSIREPLRRKLYQCGAFGRVPVSVCDWRVSVIPHRTGQTRSTHYTGNHS